MPRARKLKCDEQRPVCKRCHGSGRICEGYGVWGGGSAALNTPNVRDSLPARLFRPKTAVGASPEERGLLDWFRWRTSIKFQSSFGSRFWETLTLRASLEEPAVFHAVLAMSAVHKRIIMGDAGILDDEDAGDDRLRQIYRRQRAQAVSHLLQPQSSTHAKNAVRTALIACILFTNMDFATGRYESGQKHFQSGIHLLHSLQDNMPANPASLGCYKSNGNDNPDDSSIVQAFSRSNLSAARFGVCYWQPQTVPDDICKPLPTIFRSAEEAKDSLDLLISDTYKISHHMRGAGVFINVDDENISAKRFQDLSERNRENVKQWREIFGNSMSNFDNRRLYGRESQLGFILMQMDHAMASILADMSLQPDDVMAYDKYTEHFITIVTSAQKAVGAVKEIHMNGDEGMKPYREQFTFMPEGGWSSPLFFTALNCRIRRLRHHAIRFLQSVSTQEFIWNHRITADVAKEIMQLEHGGEFDPSEDEYDMLTPLRKEELAAPNVPRERRIDNVKIALLDNPRRAILTYTKANINGERELAVRQYDLGRQRDLLRKEDALNTYQNLVAGNALLNYDPSRTSRSGLRESLLKGSSTS